MLPPMGQHGEDGDRKIGREPQKTSATRTNFAAHFITRSIASAREAFRRCSSTNRVVFRSTCVNFWGLKARLFRPIAALLLALLPLAAALHTEAWDDHARTFHASPDRCPISTDHQCAEEPGLFFSLGRAPPSHQTS